MFPCIALNKHKKSLSHRSTFYLQVCGHEKYGKILTFHAPLLFHILCVVPELCRLFAICNINSCIRIKFLKIDYDFEHVGETGAEWDTG
jgi:hypothetical protein